MLQDAKVLITGATGQVAFPVAKALAPNNEVHALARFTAEGSREKLEALGIRCIRRDYALDNLSGVPDDYTHVLHFAFQTGRTQPSFDQAIKVNGEGVGHLMYHTRKAKTFFHCGTTAVYGGPEGPPFREDSPLMSETMAASAPTYGPSKLCGEAVARFISSEFGLPTIIARLNVPYGPNGGLPAMHMNLMKTGKEIPLRVGRPNNYNPVYEDDIVEQAQAFCEVATSPATVVNWCGSETVSAEEWCEYIGGLLGIEPKFRYTEDFIAGNSCDTTLMHQLIGRTKVPWREGMRRMVEAAPEDRRLAVD